MWPFDQYKQWRIDSLNSKLSRPVADNWGEYERTSHFNSVLKIEEEYDAAYKCRYVIVDTYTNLNTGRIVYKKIGSNMTTIVRDYEMEEYVGNLYKLVDDTIVYKDDFTDLDAHAIKNIVEVSI